MVLPVFFIANMGRIIPIVVRIGSALFGFFATNRASAVPIPIAIGIIRPRFAIKNTGRTILLLYIILIL